MRPAIEVWRDAQDAFYRERHHRVGAAVIEADRLEVVAEIVADLRSGDRGYWTWRDYAADHIEAKFGGNNGDR